MNRLPDRFRLGKRLQHHVARRIVHFQAQATNRKFVRHAAARTEVNCLTGGDRLFGVGVQTDQFQGSGQGAWLRRRAHCDAESQQDQNQRGCFHELHSYGRMRA